MNFLKKKKKWNFGWLGVAPMPILGKWGRRLLKGTGEGWGRALSGSGKEGRKSRIPDKTRGGVNLRPLGWNGGGKK